ncbi:metalloregulator ArsR/SmtB family transcription factor [Defluviimonas sp. WL0024]|uniref:Metalloregulator ArsR/SmtB family transcription factor n=2 Tax=Albidovulum TaxID=205889 RepID=A0ABT3J4F8_9RHOB|nr:metalloregulator ArsR/SmtB family transcription factor [Defluviimonas sp. WL0024]MCU9847936.1 metalloregulator ArsR/SmtB family transcription factor [Defluviimonas sp. WL0024]MCW3782350.1 metalloregulator ArsR/SmtB family transcription factor [Defluviimonas salinarum]
MDSAVLAERAEQASSLLKALAHDGRLMILCFLTSGEKSVTELETLLLSRQSAVSQQLARLRLEGLVKTRRDGKAIYYSLNDDRAARVVELVFEMYCNDT